MSQTGTRRMGLGSNPLPILTLVAVTLFLGSGERSFGRSANRVLAPGAFGLAPGAFGLAPGAFGLAPGAFGLAPGDIGLAQLGGTGIHFVRGDANGGGSVDIADVLTIVVEVFPQSGFPPLVECEDAADANDDGALGLVDVYLLLSYLFGSGPSVPPAPPFPSCGSDPTPDGLSCDGPTNCP